MPYICPAGVWTCGWGSTGRDVVPGQPWTQEYADQRMEQDAIKFAVGVLKLSPHLQDDATISALADFAYNCGLPAYEASTLRRKVALQDWKEARNQLSRWIYGGGKVLTGLVRRRKAESLLLP